MSLFVQAFLTSSTPDETPAFEFRYDEQLCVNVRLDGSPVMEIGQKTDTMTLTEVRGEADDYDHPGDDDAVSVPAETKSSRAPLMGTNTDTRVRTEPDDEDRDARVQDGFFELSTVTHSSIGGEPDDVDRDARVTDDVAHLGTLTSTFVRAETNDEDHNTDVLAGGPLIKTQVHGESDSFWLEDDQACRSTRLLTS